MDRSEVLEHAASIVAATTVPVSADLENGFGHAPEHVAGTTRLAIEAGLAGCSIEDFTGTQADPIFDLGLATERVAAAADAAHSGPVHLVVTARAENYLHGVPDLADTIARLQAFQRAGADVLYAPGLTSITDIRSVVDAVDSPVNVLTRPDGPTVPELAEAGVARISVGGAFCYAARGGDRGGRGAAGVGNLFLPATVGGGGRCRPGRVRTGRVTMSGWCHDQRHPRHHLRRRC